MSFYNRTKTNFYAEKATPADQRPQTRHKVNTHYEPPQPPEGSKEIEDFPGYYITDQGQVWSTHTYKFLTPSEDANNYLKVYLKNTEGKYKWKTLHILVARAYLPNPNNLPIVNHLDGNKHRCTVDNLEWDTYSGNIQHAYDTGLNKNLKPVIRLDANGNETEYMSIKQAVQDTPGTSRAGITGVCNGSRKTHGGYQWKWKENNHEI